MELHFKYLEKVEEVERNGKVDRQTQTQVFSYKKIKLEKGNFFIYFC